MDECVYDPKVLADFEAFLTDPESKNGVVLGCTGMGLTGLVRRCCERHDLDPVWMSVSLSFGHEFIKRAASTKSVTGRRKVMVFDEFEALSVNDVHVLNKLDIPVVYIAHGFRGRVAAAVQKAVVFRFPAPTAEHVFGVLRDVYPGVDAETLFRIAKNANGDIRGAKVAVESGFHDRGTRLLDGLDLAHKALHDDACSVTDVFRGADGTAVSAVFENYLGAKSEVSCAEAFSVGDVLPEAYSVFAVAAVGHAPCVHTGDTVKFGTLWSKASSLVAKQANVRAIAFSRATRGLPTLFDVQDLGVLRAMILAVGPEHAARIAGAAGLDPTALLAVMRLFKCKYTLGFHAKVKKHL